MGRRGGFCASLPRQAANWACVNVEEWRCACRVPGWATWRGRSQPGQVLGSCPCARRTLLSLALPATACNSPSTGPQECETQYRMARNASAMQSCRGVSYALRRGYRRNSGEATKSGVLGTCPASHSAIRHWCVV